MKKESKIKKSLIVAFLFAFFSVGSFVYIYIDTQRVYSEIFESVDILAGLQIEESKKDSVMEIMGRTKNEQVSIEGYFVSADGVVDFIESMEKLGDSFGAEVEVKSVKTVPVELSEKTERLQLVVSVEGNWSANTAFLSRIEQFPFKIEISNVLLEKIGAEKGPWRGEYIVSVLKLK